MEQKTIEVGRLGRFLFSQGYYLYAGSARGPGGLSARLGRHLAGDKPLWWHIDYLRQQADVHGIWIASGSRNLEHRWARFLAASGDASMPAPGFGASGCSCPTRLFYFRRPPEKYGVFELPPGPATRGPFSDCRRRPGASGTPASL
jgi:Uri superfamily endonuclease